MEGWAIINMSKVVEITSALTGEKMKVFDFLEDKADSADNRPVPAASADSYTGPNDQPVSLDFNSLLNGGKISHTS